MLERFEPKEGNVVAPWQHRFNLLAAFALFLLFSPADGAERAFIIGISTSNIERIDIQNPGFLIGYSKEWGLVRSLYLEGELNLEYKTTDLADKLVWYYPGILARGDLGIKMWYAEIPVLIKLALPKNESPIKLYLGPSLLLCLSGKVDRHPLHVLDDSYTYGRTPEVPKHDFSFIEDPGPAIPLTDNSSIGYNLGAQCRLFNKIFNFRYTRSTLWALDAVKFDKKYHTLTVAMLF